MLDVVYSDGPVYFKSYPFSGTNVLSIFSTFGNESNPTGNYDGPILFEDKVLVSSDDFAAFSSGSLGEYYETLAAKYAGENQAVIESSTGSSVNVWEQRSEEAKKRLYAVV